MKVVTGTITQLMKRLASRGRTLESIAPAIVYCDGELVNVDIEHPAYPKPVIVAANALSQPPRAVPGGGWPRFARVAWLLSNDRDGGVGDTVQRWAAKLGGEGFKKWADTVGLPCGCTERQQEWNTLYPYPRWVGDKALPADGDR